MVKDMQRRFSERIGKRSPKTVIQLDSMDVDLLNSLWNALEIHINIPLKTEEGYLMSHSRHKVLFNIIWLSFLKEPLDNIPVNKYGLLDEFRRRFFLWDFLEVYDFFDFLIQLEDVPFRKNVFIGHVNSILKQELSGYRIVNGLLSPIISDNEILEIERAMSKTSRYEGANIHLNEALNKLSDRKYPDYRNSIKESISAIESLCQVISNNPKAELGTALKILKEKIKIHSALEQAFIKLYGYSSDGDGIRHALLEESNLDQEDALFMLVSSSAFINYLISKADKSKELLNNI